MTVTSPGSPLFKFTVNGTIKAGQVNLTADIMPLLAALHGSGNISVVNFQTATGGVTPPPPTPVAPAVVTPPSVTPASGTVGTTFQATSGVYTGTPAPHLTGKWQFDGVDIVGATAYSFVSTSAQIGADKLTFVEHAANGTLPNVDSTSNTATVTAASADVPLANQAALIAMLAAGAGTSGGKTYQLAPGTYTQSGTWTYDFSSSPIIIKGQAGVSFNFIALDTCKGISLLGNGAHITSLFTGNYGLYAINSVGITFDDFTAPGGIIGVDGAYSGVGCFIRSSDQLTVTNNTFSQLGAGVGTLDSTNCVIASNHITNISANPILCASTQGLTIEKNYIGPLKLVAAGTHSNYIHLASTGTTGRTANAVIRFNNCEQPGGTSSNGFIIGLESVDGATIISNCGFDNGANGITVVDTTNTLINDNFMQGWTNGPRIYCRGGSDNITMSANFSVAQPFSLVQPPEPNSTNVTISANTTIPQATSSTDTSRRDAFIAARPNIPAS